LLFWKFIFPYTCTDIDFSLHSKVAWLVADTTGGSGKYASQLDILRIFTLKGS